MQIRLIAKNDYKNLIDFWHEHYFVSDMDSQDRFDQFLEKNPELSFLVEENGKIVGTVLGSFDGRRGYIQKLVVDKNTRKTGVGKILVERVITELKYLGSLYVPISVEESIVGFYEKCGFKKTNQVPMNISY